jgi:hypothetical protein
MKTPSIIRIAKMVRLEKTYLELRKYEMHTSILACKDLLRRTSFAISRSSRLERIYTVIESNQAVDTVIMTSGICC